MLLFGDVDETVLVVDSERVNILEVESAKAQGEACRQNGGEAYDSPRSWCSAGGRPWARQWQGIAPGSQPSPEVQGHRAFAQDSGRLGAGTRVAGALSSKVARCGLAGGEVFKDQAPDVL